MQLQETAVKKYARENGLNILQPLKLKDPEFLEQLRAINADLQIVVAFRMLPEVVWNMPPMGTINLHGSLLPQYRGAAPINWAIINGEKQTGVTSFKLKHQIDTGDILLSAVIPIGEDENAGELHDRMKEAGADLLVQTVRGMVDGTLVETPQNAITVENAGLQGTDFSALKTAPKIFTETCLIDWKKTVDEIYNLIRGLSPYPGAFTYLEGLKMKIFSADKLKDSSPITPGGLETDKKTFLYFSAIDGFVSIKELQPEGKRKMTIDEFLRGYRWKDAAV
jgi:methionyl-tRNA formyltransferase